MKQARYKATAVLAASAVSWAAVTPFSGTFVGAMLQHGFLAATIGGLADWFAVTALFKKPLGIGYRTNIIVRNRERIFNELVTFIGNDLLSPANIMKIVERYDTSRMLYAYMEENSGLDKTQALLNTMAADMLENMETDQLAMYMESILENDIDKLPSNKILADMLAFALANGYDGRIIRFILSELEGVVAKREFQVLVSGLIDEMKERYAADSSRRQIVSMVLAVSSDKLAALAQQKLTQLLAELQDDEHELRLKLKEWCEKAVEELRVSQKWNERINEFLLETGRRHLDIAEECRRYKLKLCEQFKTGDASPLNPIIARKVKSLKQDVGFSRRIDRRLKKGIDSFLDQQHSIIIGIVNEKLTAFSNEELLEFIEGRVGDDLQMIRINGSLVGGVVGVLLFLVTYLVGEVCR